MPETRKCSSCGVELPPDEPSSLCPRCLASSTVDVGIPPSRVGPAGTIVVPLPFSEKPGDKIGRYKLLEQIGEGGFGVVYVADQEEPVRRRVALKVIKLGMDTKEVIARFEAERQALALMDHPNIAKVLDAGATASGRPYFVMELVKGERITEYCDKNSLTTRQRLDLFVQICHAIQHAHQKGIIHRDIKPSNVLVAMHDGAPIPKVIDFGIAKATEHRLTDKTIYTALEQLIGTPAYMSPEQAEMSGVDIDTRSDIYSLGVLLYELLTGKTPFDAKELLAKGIGEMRRTIREQEPRRPSTRLTTMDEGELTTTAKNRQTDSPKLLNLVRGDLDWIVMKCLEKDRTRRYDTANGLAFDLTRHRNNEPVLARPPSNVYRFQKMVRRNKLAFAAGTAVAGAVLAGLALSTFLFIQERRAHDRALAAEHVANASLQHEAALREQAQAAEKKAVSEAKLAEDSAKEVRMNLAAADFSKAINLIAQDDRSGALAYLARSLSLNPANAAASARLATLLASHPWEVSVVMLRQGTNLVSAEFSPDGKRILAISSDNTARVWDAQDGQPLTEPWKFGARGFPYGDMRSAKFSPDGNEIVTASGDGSVRLWDAQSGQPRIKPLEIGGMVMSVQFSPDGRRIVTDTADGKARVWDAQSGRPLTEAMYHSNSVSAQFSPDGQRIVTLSWRGTAQVWDAQSGKPMAEPWRNDQEVHSAQFSPDGKRILLASGDAARVWDAQSGQPLTEPLSHGGVVNSAQFSPDGRWIVTASRDKTARVWDAGSGQPLTGPLQHGSAVLSALFTPDGAQVLTVSSDSTARVWDARSGQPLTEPLKHSGTELSAQFSPDGKRMVTISDDQTAQVWNVKNGEQLTESLHHGAWVRAAQFSPDGKRIVTASQDDTARVWDARSGQPLTGPLKHIGPVEWAQFSPDGKRIVTISLPSRAQVWDAQNGQPLTEPWSLGVFKSMFSPNPSAQFSSDGKRLVTVSLFGTAQIWDAHSGSPLAVPLPHSQGVMSAQFSPDGKRILTASLDHTARVWDAHSGQPLTQPLQHSGGVNSAQFSPDGKWIVTASMDNTARVWDAQNGQPLTEPLEHGSVVVSAQFSPDGKRIVTASGDGTARVWDAQTGQPLTDRLTHGRSVNLAQFSPDGKWIVTASMDDTARVWDAQSGQPLTAPLQCRSNVMSAQFSPDGRRIVTASFDETARIWDFAPAPTPSPDWLPQLAQAISGQVLNKQGVLERTRLNRSDILNQLRQRLNQEPDDGDWVHWGRWLLADPATRTISPFSTMSVSEYIESLIVAKTSASLAEAQRLALGNAELSERIVRARGTVDQTSRAATLKQEAQKLAAQGRWKEAAANFSKSVELSPEDYSPRDCFELSALLAQSGDLDGYRQNCARALQRFGGTRDFRVAQGVAQACLLLPAPGVDLADIDKLGKTAATCPSDDLSLLYCQFAKGLAEYRQEHFASGAEWIQKTLSGGGSAEAVAQSCLVLAMAQYQLHQTNQARSSFAKGFAMVETELSKMEASDPRNDWGDRIQTELLAKEAKELIAGQKMDADLSDRIAQLRGNFSVMEQVEPKARAGRWKEAVGDCARVMEDKSDDDLFCYNLATLLAQSGDLEGYRRHCARILARFGSTQEPLIAGRTVKACLILPDSGVDLGAVGRLAEIAVGSGTSDPNLAAFQFGKGLAEYRQRRFASAVEWEQKALDDGTVPAGDAEAWMVMGMARCQLKHPEEARNALANGSEIVATKLPKLESGDIGADWRNWIIAHALPKEAKELIEGQTTVK